MVNTRDMATRYKLAHWAQVMKERKASGMSIREYCKRYKLCENTYFYWRRKLRETASQELLTVNGANVVDINAKSCTSTVPNGWAVYKPAGRFEPSASTGTENGISIEIGDSRISVGSDVDTGLLTKVCQVLKSL